MLRRSACRPGGGAPASNQQEGITGTARRRRRPTSKKKRRVASIPLPTMTRRSSDAAQPIKDAAARSTQHRSRLRLGGGRAAVVSAGRGAAPQQLAKCLAGGVVILLIGANGADACARSPGAPRAGAPWLLVSYVAR